MTSLIESSPIERHNIYTCLPSVAIGRNIPCTFRLIRPFATDVSTIFCCNSKACILFITIAKKAIVIDGIEFYAVNISLIINIYNRGTVTGNGFLLNLLCSKALIIFIFAAFCSGSCLCASNARFYFDILRGILVIICIFKPMDNGVFRFGIGFPVCGDGCFCGNRCYFLTIDIPTVERVTAAGGCDRAQVKRRFHSELRRHVVAAFGIKCDPETGFNYRVNVCIAGYKCDGFGGIAARRGAPADNAFFFAHGELDFCGRGVQICFRNLFTGYACGGVINHLCTVFIHEVYVAVHLKLRRKFYGRTAGYGSNFAKTFKEIAAFIVPPNKTCIVFFGCRRLEELFAFGDGLRPIGQLLAVCIIETVGIDRGLLVVVRNQHSG